MKEYLSKSQLLKKATNQGLIIEDEDLFYKYIEKAGYQKSVIYCRRPFGEIVNDEFAYNNDTKFEYLAQLYDFDFNLRLLTFKYISIIEEKVKSQLSEYVSKTFGTDYKEFVKIENFVSATQNDIEDFEKLKTSIENDIKNIIHDYENSQANCEVPRIKNDYIIDAYYNDDNKIPFWCITTLLSLGQIAKIFSKMKKDLCSNISSLYSLQPVNFAAFVKRINWFRNICAHQEKLYDFKTITIARTKNLKYLYQSLSIDCSNNKYKQGTQDYLSLVIALKMLLDSDDFCTFCDELLRLINILETKLPTEAFDRIIKMMGLNNNWYNVLAYERWEQNKKEV